MPYVITDACVDIKDRACVLCCPVDCIYEGTVTGLGSPGSASGKVTPLAHPFLAALPVREG